MTKWQYLTRSKVKNKIHSISTVSVTHACVIFFVCSFLHVEFFATLQFFSTFHDRISKNICIPKNNKRNNKNNNNKNNRPTFRLRLFLRLYVYICTKLMHLCVCVSVCVAYIANAFGFLNLSLCFPYSTHWFVLIDVISRCFIVMLTLKCI